MRLNQDAIRGSSEEQCNVVVRRLQMEVSTWMARCAFPGLKDLHIVSFNHPKSPNKYDVEHTVNFPLDQGAGV